MEITFNQRPWKWSQNEIAVTFSYWNLHTYERPLNYQYNYLMNCPDIVTKLPYQRPWMPLWFRPQHQHRRFHLKENWNAIGKIKVYNRKKAGKTTIIRYHVIKKHKGGKNTSIQTSNIGSETWRTCRPTDYYWPTKNIQNTINMQYKSESFTSS